MIVPIPVVVLAVILLLLACCAYVGAATKALVLEDMNKTLSGILSSIFEHLKTDGESR